MHFLIMTIIHLLYQDVKKIIMINKENYFYILNNLETLSDNTSKIISIIFLRKITNIQSLELTKNRNIKNISFKNIKKLIPGGNNNIGDNIIKKFKNLYTLILRGKNITNDGI